MCPKGVTDKLLLGFPLRLGQKMLQFPSYAFFKIVFENGWSIFSRSSCEMHLRNKDFLVVDDLSLVTIRHPSDLRQFFSTFTNDFEALSQRTSKKRLWVQTPLPQRYCQPPKYWLSVQWDVILGATTLLIKGIF